MRSRSWVIAVVGSSSMKAISRIGLVIVAGQLELDLSGAEIDATGFAISIDELKPQFGRRALIKGAPNSAGVSALGTAPTSFTGAAAKERMSPGFRSTNPPASSINIGGSINRVCQGQSGIGSMSNRGAGPAFPCVKLQR